MRHRWLGLLLAVSLVGCASGDDGDGTDEVVGPGPGPGPGEVEPAPAPLSDADVVARAGAAVWRVETEGCEWLGSGSAFAIDRRHLVTNRHVIANDVTPVLVSPTGERRSGRVIGAGPEADVAVIEVDDDLPVTLQWAPTESLQPAEPLVVLGYPAPALVFTVSVGSIVNFQGRDGAREAMLTNAPIAPGNSGGPGLRADATVAGVVTQMTLDDPAERAAIIFTAASVEEAVEAFIADPQEVVSDCGQGPDYVPPIPDHFDVPSVPPLPPVTATTAPIPLPTGPPSTRPATTTTTTTVRPATTRPAPTTSTAPPCPAGGLEVEIDASIEPDDIEGRWVVTIEGRVHNTSTEPASVAELVVPVLVGEADPVLVNVTMPSPEALDGGRTQSFVVPATVESDVEPEVGPPRLAWAWWDPDLAGCPTG